MALGKSIETIYKVDALYHKIMGIYIDFALNKTRVRVDVYSYATEATKNASPLSQRTYTIILGAGNDIQEQAYNGLKQLEDWQDSEDK